MRTHYMKKITFIVLYFTKRLKFSGINCAKIIKNKILFKVLIAKVSFATCLKITELGLIPNDTLNPSIIPN